MHKNLFLICLIVSSSAFAITKDVATFDYDGSQSSKELVLRTEVYHTEYNVEDVISTCYRTETVGHRTICTGSGYPGPYYPGPQGPYYPGPRGPYYPGPYSRQCYTEPMTRQVPYSCTVTTRLPYQVKDYDVEARVIIDVTKSSYEATPGETFKATLEGDFLNVTASGSKKFFIVKKKQDQQAALRGSVKMIDALYAFELVEAAPILKSLNMTNIALDKSLLKIKLGAVESSNTLNFSLKIVQNKLLASDKTILDRDLLASEVTVQTAGTESEVTVDLAKLGVTLEDGKFSITAKATPKFDGSLVNLSQFNDLSASRTLVFKSR